MDDRRKWIILAILCVALTIVVIGLSSGLAAKSTLPPPSEPEEIVDPQPSQESLSSTTVAPDVLTTPENTKPWQLTRLPVQVQPYHYDVHLIPDLESGKFTGTVDIGLRVLNPTSYVIVNLAFLNVTSVVLSSFEQSQDIQVHFAYAQNEVYVVESSWLLPEDNYTLHMEFEGSLVGSLVGFYRSSYMDTVKNVTRYLAASKFEPTYARRAFPCFDEPDLKATFQITLTHSPDMTALSNMNVKSSRESNGVTETIFNTSVPMSTYLVTFVVCDFNFTENKTEKGKPFRVFSRPDQINSTKYALNAGIQVQDYYEEYFSIPYPLPKQDMIAVPDFVSGAMEHWGLITYRETLLFYEEKKVSASQKRSIANVIAHELTHQWFGNLVTMKWWDDLWLNEGFASYFAYEGMAQLDTDWNNWRKSADFLLETLHESLRLDSSLSSHPIIQPVNHPDEITSIFDLISYRKGASVIRMLEAFITEEAFKRALHKYLTLFAYRNAETKDLWNLMTQENTGINVTKVMNTWTHQMGYPVVFVKREGNKFIVNQTRFLEDNSLTVNISESPYRYLWEIPLTYKLGSGGEVKTRWMNLDQQITWEEQDLSNVEFIKFNIDQTGVYRVNYEKAIWDQLIEAMCQNTSKKSSSGLSEADFTNLLDDSFALFYNGMLSQNIFFELCKCLQYQRHYSMWIIAANGFRSLSNLLKDTSAITVLRNFAIKLVTPMYDDVGWEDEGTYQDRVLRNVILEFACDFDHVSCLEVASKKFGDWINDSNSVPIDLQDVVLMNGLSASGANSTVLWETIWSRYLVEPSPQTKSDLLSCLATTQTPWLLSRLLESTFNEKEIRSQDAINVISDVSSNPTGMYIAWHFYRANWKRLVEKFQLNDRNLGNLVKSLTSRFTTETSLSEMRDFFEKNPDAGAGDRARRQAISQVKANIKWIELRQEELISYLQSVEITD